MWFKKSIALYCLLWLLPVCISAQSFLYTQYTTRNGLPIDNVYAATQDEDGFMWVGTDFGIAKFDGYRFVNYYKQHGILNKAVINILYAGGDSCLFVSYPRTIQAVHKNGIIKTVIPDVTFTVQEIVMHDDAFYLYARGSIKLARVKNGQLKVLLADSLFNNKGVAINGVISLPNKNLGICTNKGLYIINGNSIKHCLQNEDVRFAVLNKNNEITAVSNNRIVTGNADFAFATTAITLPPPTVVYKMMYDAEGALWLRGMEKGIWRVYNGQLQEMSEALHTQNLAVHNFFSDKDGNTWFCTDGAGILFRSKNAFNNYTVKHGLANNKITRFLKLNNDLYIGTANGLSVMRGKQLHTLPLPAYRPGVKYVHQLLPLYNNVPGICIANTFSYNSKSFLQTVEINGQKFTVYNNAFSAVQYNNKQHWASSTGFLNNVYADTQYKAHNLMQFGIQKGYEIMYLQNRLWMGTDNGVLWLHNNKWIHTDSAQGIKIGEVFQFLQRGADTILMATEKGLLYYANNTFTYAALKGETYGSNYCRSICVDNTGKIWGATWDGIFVTDGNTRYNYSTNAGLPSRTCNAIFYDSTSNQLYVGTDYGLSIADKDSIQQLLTVNKIFIEATASDTISITNGQEVEAGYGKLRFYFSIPSYANAGNVHYVYRVDDSAWIKTSTPIVNLTGVGAGKHVLFVKALVNGTAIINEATAFTFFIKTPFYKSWWFILTMAALCQLLIIWLVYKYNKNIREKKLASQRTDNEMASLKQQAFTSLMNPHFIFNALNSIQYYINKQDRQTANKYLSDFATLVRRSFDAAQKPYVTLEEELETLRLYLQLEKMRFTDKFDYNITLNEAAEAAEWLLPGMVLQPFLENAVLHGLAPLSSHGQINVTIAAANNTLYITITDNGIGMQKSKQLRTGKKHNSRGMQLIKERLDILSTNKLNPITLTITENSPGAENPGTKIALVVPQAVYEND
jgi:ligand-binding sensor domain-containing protein